MTSRNWRMKHGFSLLKDATWTVHVASFSNEKYDSHSLLKDAIWPLITEGCNMATNYWRM
jgi:hypothetical protein